MFEIIKGGKSNIPITLKNKAAPQDPFDWTGVTEISTCFKNADGTELTLTKTGGAITVVDDRLGKISIALTAAQTALLAEVISGTIELSITFVGDPVKTQIPEAYSVLASVC